ncbi:YkgJ family cysteine cluster protein [Anoxybacillus sp. MB8]|uniref:YkgJ family cysteine cluster protein n=1 Tax=Anoxybacillus sp. MB8 TaxID=2496850 RepID=UPI0013D4748A|nr:YkgJ family cysteine cluster protein [Anoxybacillus sp. MB8]
MALTYDQIVRICKQINDKHMPDGQAFVDVVDEWLERYDGENGKEFMFQAFKKLLSLVDEHIHTIERKVNIRPTCTKGCTHCCYFPIITTRAEARWMMTHIAKLPNDERERIYKHIKWYTQHYAEQIKRVETLNFTEERHFKKMYMEEQIPCIFLNQQTNTCLIYDVRPIPCRTYVNYCSPSVCANSHMPNEPFSYEFLYEFYIDSLHDFIQTLIYEGEEVGIDYPDDLFTMDYLFCYFMDENK